MSDLRERAITRVEESLTLWGFPRTRRPGVESVNVPEVVDLVLAEALAEVERLREALRCISEYGTHEGDLLDGHEDAMRNIAQNALDASPASSDHQHTPDEPGRGGNDG